MLEGSDAREVTTATAAMSDPFFDLPTTRTDSLRELAAGGERVLRALGRRLRQGRSPLRREDIGRWTRPPLPDLSESQGPVVLYLPALPWSFRFQRPQQLAVALAELGPAVLYLEAFDRLRLNPPWRRRLDRPALQVVSRRLPGLPDPFRQPFPQAAIEPLVAEVADHLRRRPEAVFAQLPFWSPFATALAQRLTVPLVYDRIDLHTAFPGTPAQVGEVETELLAAADLVTATSPDLAQRSLPHARRVELLPNAVDLERLPLAPSPGNQPPRAGFVGALDGRIDTTALRRCLDQLPWELHLAGRVEDPAVRALGAHPRVTLYGEIPFSRVAAFLADLDVGLVPYTDQPLTRAIDSVKLYEMLAVGLPVIARRLPGLAAWEGPEVALYDTPDELVARLRHRREDDGPEARLLRRQRVANEGWSARARRLAELLEIPVLGSRSSAHPDDSGQLRTGPSNL
ncbi:MAG: glycosyltransferase [Acidobacteriota bacterium]